MNVLVFLGAVLLYGAWGALVLFGKTDPGGYVVALGAGLTFLGKHVSTPRVAAVGGLVDRATDPAVDTQAPAAPAAVAAPAPIPASAIPVIPQPQASHAPLQ